MAKMKQIWKGLKQYNKFQTSYTIVKPDWYLLWKKNTQLDRFSLSLVNSSSSIAFEQDITIVGDIFLTNERELISYLNLKQQNPSTHEIIATLWQKLGIESLSFLKGMFAFVVWEQQQGKLHLVRDRTGFRTLYYIFTENTCYLAPRLRTLLPFHCQELDLIALRDYLCCAFVPGERTLWQNIRELRPGTVLSLPRVTINTYWQPQEIVHKDAYPIEWYGTQLRSQLEQVVSEYLPQNESIGVYLSGGLDSSCITALAAKYHQNPIHTYSIHFGAELPNELEFSSLVAQHCQTQHHILEITPQMMWENLAIVMSHLDDPIGDPLTVPNYLLAHLAKQDTQIILNGEGGDPCFGGPKNQPMLLNQLYQGSGNMNNLLKAYLTSFKKCFLDLENLLKPDIFQETKEEEYVWEADLNSNAQYLNRLMLLNIKFKGADHILTKVNNLTQSANLRGLSPLFDYRIVEIAMATPPKFKLKGAEEKAVLKQAVYDLLPEMIIKRPKSGMQVPVQYFFRKYWQRQARGLLLSKTAKIKPYLNQYLIRDWLNYQGDVWRRYGAKLWLLVS